MRILHVTDGYLPRLGGIERQVHDLALRQLALGHHVEILTSVSGGENLPAGVPIHRPRARFGSSPTRLRYFAAPRHCRLVAQGDYDVVHIHSSTLSPLAYYSAGVATRAGIPAVMTVHSFWDWASPIFSVFEALKRWRKWPIVWSSVSSVAAAPLQRMVTDANPVAILPNGVDPAEWRLTPRLRDPDEVVIAGVMRLAGRKRPRQFLAMLREARAKVPAEIKLEAVIIGDGPLRDRLQRYLHRHHMSDWVTLAGRGDHTQIKDLFRRADLFVAPALLESFGIAALEARSAGLPVVAHVGSGVRDFIEHGREGLLADGDADMVNQIVELATDPQLRERMREHNEAVEPAVHWADVLRRCDELYQQAGVPVGAAEVALQP
jgi:glycosyltransferase involved in cell wall biosynthesis